MSDILNIKKKMKTKICANCEHYLKKEKICNKFGIDTLGTQKCIIEKEGDKNAENYLT